MRLNKFWTAELSGTDCNTSSNGKDMDQNLTPGYLMSTQRMHKKKSRNSTRSTLRHQINKKFRKGKLILRRERDRRNTENNRPNVPDSWYSG
jgi:hypothetical protein